MSNMNIVINALSARRGGGQTYLHNLLQHLDSCSDMRFYMLAPDYLHLPAHPQLIRIPVQWPTENPISRTAYERFVFPLVLKKLKADVLFCPGGLLTTKVPEGCKTIIMFQNMIPFDPIQRAKYHFGLMKVRNWILEKVMLKSMIAADLVVFISDFARRMIEKRAPGKIKKAVTIPHGLSEHFKVADGPVPSRPNWLPQEEYLLYVSIFDVYKNQLEVVQAFQMLKQKRHSTEKLVLAGYNLSSYGHKVRKEIRRLNMQDDVILPGNISYEDLPSVYWHAKLNIFASECENCPNILLEALGAGRPVLVSNRAPMPEFGGDAVLYFDPASPQDLANKIAAVIDDPVSMKELSSKARAHSLQYEWKETAQHTWKAIRDLCQSSV